MYALIRNKTNITSSIFIILLCCLAGIQLQAQDLEPRLLSPTPTGGNFAIASYGYSVGNILLDNTLPIEDLTARLNTPVPAYARSFSLFKKLTKFDVITPYAFGTYNAIVDGVDTSATRHGFGDPMIRLSMILVGTGAMNAAEFPGQVPKKFNLGTALRIVAPLGQYDPTKLINLSANRWAFKWTLAASYTLSKKWVFEGHFNSAFFTENDEFFNGNTLKQTPLLSTQFHTTYIFKPGIWLAASFGRSYLGETVLNGEERNDQQDASRYGLVFAYRLSKHSALKLGFTSGITARYGADFTTFVLAYQHIWFDKRR